MTRNYLSRPLFVEKDGTMVYRTELMAAHERIEQLEATLHDCREFIEDQSDVVDGDYGEPAPNRAMRLVQLIDETLSEKVKP